MPRYFLNLPSFGTVADIDAHCDRIGAVRVGGYRGVDGLRTLVEVPEVAIARLALEALEFERRARELRAVAEEREGE